MLEEDDGFRAPKNDAEYNRFFDAAIAGSVPALDACFGPNINVNALQANRLRGESALHMAASSGHLPTLRWLLEHGADVNLKDSRNGTALNKAAYGAHIRAAELLLDAGAQIDLETGSRSSYTALSSVLQGKQIVTPQAIAMIELLLKRGFSPAKPVDHMGFTVFDEAARLGSFQLVGLLQRMGVDPHHSVYAARRNYDMVEFLLKYGAKIAADRKNGCTITLTAAEGNIRILRLLLSFADENDINRAAAALYWAAEKGHIDIVDLLLDHGWNINASCGPCGRTALFGACKCEVIGLRQGEEPSLDLIEHLLSKDADMSFQDDWGETILHAVAGPTSTPELISTLLSAGASTSTRALHHGSFDGGIPLHSFAERLSTATSANQPLSIVSRLLTNFFLILSHTDNVNIQDSKGQTPLHRLGNCDFGPTPLVVQGRLQAARLLITRGADTRLKDSKGRTPGDFLCRDGQGLDTILAKLAGMHAHRYCFMLLLPG